MAVQRGEDGSNLNKRILCGLFTYAVTSNTRLQWCLSLALVDTP